MLTVGVDLAAEAANTAVARIGFGAGRARVVEVLVGADDAAILGSIDGADKAGIDCPLGWPEAFVEFLNVHRHGVARPPSPLEGRAWRRTLTARVTDEVVRMRTGLVPLSVSADRIAHPALRCAALLGALATDGIPIDRSGVGVVVEVYPAASLKTWGLPYRRYKGTPNRPALDGLVDALRDAAPWLDLGGYEPLCRRSDHATDAVICALTARAAALDLTAPPDDDQRRAAAVEGWIAVPTGNLATLAH